MRVAKLSDGRVVHLLKHDVSVLFSTTPGWSLVSKDKNLWWVQSTVVVWILNFKE